MVKSTGADPQNYILRSVTEQSSFQDHAGNPAVSVWRYYEGSPEQPGYSYQVYVTTGHGHDASSTIPTDLLNAIHKNQVYIELWRLDFYFLPLADAETCMEHYRREKAHRQGAKMHTVPSYEGTECWHHNVLFRIDDERWKETGLEVVEFDKTDFEDDPNDSLGILEQEAYRAPTLKMVADAMLGFWSGCRLRQEYEVTFWVDEDAGEST